MVQITNWTSAKAQRIETNRCSTQDDQRRLAYKASTASEEALKQKHEREVVIEKRHHAEVGVAASDYANLANERISPSASAFTTTVRATRQSMNSHICPFSGEYGTWPSSKAQEFIVENREAVNTEESLQLELSVLPTINHNPALKLEDYKLMFANNVRIAGSSTKTFQIT
ncbi:unnamed protein product [Gongylonema pulchrum]|uniref:Uncharacterized protein n=1 Tax=Gongylonema pulchrum TaxID=637853 RepID=A0A183EJ32_9BILA|nr:unnamed protein product [Gongylonema pulchrum]